MRRHSRLTRLAAGFRLILAGVSVLLPEQIKVVVRGEGPEKTQNKQNNSLNTEGGIMVNFEQRNLINKARNATSIGRECS